MYKEIDQLEVIPNESIVRRYMSITKFLSVIENNSLFFPSLDLLAKEDKFEGLFNLVDHPLPALVDQVDNNFQRNYRKHCFVNCWNYALDESYALWKIYLDNGGDGVVIETTVSQLQECFKAFPEEIYMGKVNYSPLCIGSRFFTCTTKRPQFQYEQEIRMIYEKVPPNEKEESSVEIPPLKKGYTIPIDLQILFGRVITSPFASSWFHDLVRAVMNKYGYTHVEVKKSSLSTEPI